MRLIACLLLFGTLGGCSLPSSSGPQSESGAQTSAEDSESAPEVDGSTSGDSSALPSVPTEQIVLTEGKTALVCVVYPTGNTDYATVADNLCTQLARQTGNTVTFSKFGSKNLSKTEGYASRIVVGEIAGLSDALFDATLRTKDSRVEQNGKDIVLLGRSSDAVIAARALLLDHTAWTNGSLLLDDAVFGKSKSGIYRIGDLRVGDSPISGYTLLADEKDRSAAEQIHEVIETYSGVLLPIATERTEGGRYLTVDSARSSDGYRIAAAGNGLGLSYDGVPSTLALMLQDIEQRFKKVSYGGDYEMSDLATEETVNGTVKIMTFNVLNPGSGSTHVGDRDDLAAAMILRELPDFLCLQEFDVGYRTSPNGLPTLLSEQYNEVQPQGVEERDIWNAIFYRKDLYSMVDCGYISFLANSIPALEYNYNGTTDGKTKFRSLLWAVLESKTDGTRYLIGNMHYSVNNEQADHIVESNFVIERFKALSAQFPDAVTLICGDYNSGTTWEQGGAYNMLQNGFFDTHAMAKRKTDTGTCHILGEAQSGTYESAAIDHVFTLSDLIVEAYATLTDADTLACSDHCPTVVRFSPKCDN